MRQRRRIFTLWLVIALVMAPVPALLAEETEKINLNTGTVEELARLENVGLKKAQLIVDYREANGPFEKPEDIVKVKGIGSKTFEMNKDRITVE